MEAELKAEHNGSAISLRGLTKRLGPFELGPLDVEIPSGFVTGFVGPNGAGKTTTIKAILGLITPDAGRITRLGEEPEEPSTRDRIGVVLDEPTVAPEWRVGSIGRRLKPFFSTWDEDLYIDLARRFGLRTDQKAGELSRGQKVKLSLAMALAHHPELLVLDEPSSGLDPVSRADLVDLLRDFMIEPEHTVLFSTHITTDLDNLSDQLCVINRGQLAYYGTLDDLHEQFAMVRGQDALPAPAAHAAIGLQHHGSHYEGLINVADTALFGPDVVIEPATTDDVVVHLARNSDHLEEVPA